MKNFLRFLVMLVLLVGSLHAAPNTPINNPVIQLNGVASTGFWYGNGSSSSTVVPFGTTAGTVMQGNDSRVAGALQIANNLSELTATASTARTNLGFTNLTSTRVLVGNGTSLPVVSSWTISGNTLGTPFATTFISDNGSGAITFAAASGQNISFSTGGGGQLVSNQNTIVNNAYFHVGTTGATTATSTGSIGMFVTNAASTANATQNYGAWIQTTGSQTSTADFYGLVVNDTGTFGNGTHNLLDLRLSGTSVYTFGSAGTIGAGPTFVLRNSTSAANIAINSSGQNVLTGIGGTATAAINQMGGTSFTGASVAQIGSQIAYTVNQTGTSSFTDLLINRTNTAAGSGTQRLLDLQVATVSQFNISTGGSINAQGSIIVANGGASSPSYTWGGSNTTGIYWANPGIGLSVAATGIDTFNVAAASTPIENLSGAWFTSGSTTTNLPQLFLQPAGTTTGTWSGNGTGFGINAPSGFSGNLVDMQVAGSRKFNIDSGGGVAAAGQFFANANGASSPGYTFLAFTSTGLYAANPGIGFSVAGASVGSWTATQLTILNGSGGGTLSLNGATVANNNSGQITVAASGTNQNVVLTPSGSGLTSIGGNLAISAGKVLQVDNNNNLGWPSAGNFTLNVGGTGILTATSAGLQTPGKIINYNGSNTAGIGVTPVWSAPRATAVTNATTSLTAYTVGGSDASFEVSANVLVTATTAAAMTVTCTYTSEDNVSRTLTLGFAQLSGATFITSITNVTGTGPYESPTYHIRCKAGTTITFATTGTVTGITYNIEGTVVQLS